MATIEEIGGEFALINRLKPLVQETGTGVIVPNGDDAAVVALGDGLTAVTTDAFTEGSHFNFSFFSEAQAGRKMLEAAASDIVAMGGQPRYFLVALALPSTTAVERVEAIYKGLAQASARLGCVLLGGNISGGVPLLTATVTVLGVISPGSSFCTRGGARAGDRIFVSGPVGGSAVGLALLTQGVPGHEEVKRRHLEPRCRSDIGTRVASFSSSMIDISDGLASEIHHLCAASGCGCVIDEEKVPIGSAVEEAARVIKLDPYAAAFSGGEDFELLYTVPSQAMGNAFGVEIGVCTEGRDVLIERRGVKRELPVGGFDHFRDFAG